LLLSGGDFDGSTFSVDEGGMEESWRENGSGMGRRREGDERIDLNVRKKMDKIREKRVELNV
jgi:hypothetical protein